MIIWGYKGYQKNLGRPKAISSVPTATMLHLGTLLKPVESLHSIGFQPFLTVENITSPAQSASTASRLKSRKSSSF